MDPMDRGPEQYGYDQEPGRPPRPPRDALTQDFGQPAPALARTVQLVAGDYLLTVNPVDGSEIEVCPPGEQPARPTRFTPAERAELRRAGRPPLPPGPASARRVLLEREEERERVVRLLARGRSVRLTGAPGSGRSALLDAVAEDCADLAPDGVVRLSGHRRTPDDLLHGLFAAVYNAPLHRPDRGRLLELVHDIGAIVVLDDLEFGGSALDDLVAATPECAFVVAVTPDVAEPSEEARFEEVVLGGLGRGGGIQLLERGVGRVLTDEESSWAGDLWFESEGLPLRFVQAGALLQQRDRLRADPNAFDAYGNVAEAPVDAPFDEEAGQELPLPSLAEGAAPAATLASRLSPSARATLAFAVALGGEVPHQAHLPALVGDTHADAALTELVGTALVTPVGGRHRLAAGVLDQLTAEGFGRDAAAHALTAAQHYAWWAGHPSVTPERATAEADAILAALTALVSGQTPGAQSTAVLLARTAAPALAAGLLWGAWERTLRAGQEASRLAGEIAEEAYFHHELGIHALCNDRLDRARAELEASIGLRGAVADKRGTVAGRRALALVADRSGIGAHDGRTAAGEEVPAARYEESASPPGGVPAGLSATGLPAPEPETLVTRHATPPAGTRERRGAARAVVTGARRNLVAAGAGALLAAVLGTVVTLGATSDGEPDPDRVTTEQSASEDQADNGITADEPEEEAPANPAPGEDGVPGTADDPEPETSGSSTSPDESKEPSDDPTDDPSDKPTTKPPTTKPPTTKPPTTKPPTTKPPTTPPPSTEEPDPSESPTKDPDPEPSEPENSDTASGPAPSSPQASDPASEEPGTPSGTGTDAVI